MINVIELPINSYGENARNEFYLEGLGKIKSTYLSIVC